MSFELEKMMERLSDCGYVPVLRGGKVYIEAVPILRNGQLVHPAKMPPELAAELDFMKRGFLEYARGMFFALRCVGCARWGECRPGGSCLMDGAERAAGRPAGAAAVVAARPAVSAARPAGAAGAAGGGSPRR